MEGKVELSTDFISDLPTSILHHILSYLSSKDSIRTSALSKQWNSVQKSFPLLLFRPPITPWLFLHQSNEPILEYLHFVDRSLKNFVWNKLTIEKMNLRVPLFDRGSVPLVNTWLPIALHNGASDLRVDFFPTNKNDSIQYSYPLPETTFLINSSLLLCGSSGFFLLKRLELCRVCLTEKIIDDIIRNCLNLSDLRLHYFYGLKSLNISKPNKLGSLTLWEPSTLGGIFVDGPSLQRFSFKSIYSLSIPCEIDLISCCNLREFELYDMNITDAQFNTIVSGFPLLEVLKIAFCVSLRRISISLQQLKSLTLTYVPVEAIEIDAPVLSEFSWESHDLFIPALVLAGPIPGCMRLTYNAYHNLGSFWFLMIREYLSVPFKDLTFYLEYYIKNVSFDLEKIRESVIPPLVEIGCLDLTYLNLKYSSEWEALLDGLLWSCHPKKICLRYRPTTGDENHCVKTLCRMLNKSECQLCSNLSHCMCWRRRFKAATIKGTENTETEDIVFDELNVRSVVGDFFEVKCQKPSRSAGAKFCPETCLTVRFDWED